MEVESKEARQRTGLFPYSDSPAFHFHSYVFPLILYLRL